jgi:hypothetical protein
MNNNKLIVFQDAKIRRVWHVNEWYFSVIDVIAALIQNTRTRKYWSDLKIKLKEEGFEVSDKIGQLKMVASDGKLRLTDCANTKNLFRIIQSIPSKKAEPFKRWLAKVGYERIQEIENPELAQNRAKDYYKLKGYPSTWIEKRIRGIAVRQDLTDEWKNRGVQENIGFAILTNEISKATFDIPIKEHKKIKALDPKFKNQNLRDHMSDWELILTMVGEKATTDITKIKDSQGFVECKDSANKGGNIAKRTRLDIEKNIGKSVISKKNFLSKKKKKLIK